MLGKCGQSRLETGFRRVPPHKQYQCPGISEINLCRAQQLPILFPRGAMKKPTTDKLKR